MYTHHASRITHTIITSLLFLTTLYSQPFCGNEIDLNDYHALRAFREPYVTALANNPSVASNIEKSIPIQIIYVNTDDGIPSNKNYRISEQIEDANTIYDGFLNFYVCGYRHINSTQFNNYITLNANRVALFNLYHSETAINIYLVNTVKNNSGESLSGWAAFPSFPTANNFIVIAANALRFTLSHELGHHFGLSHTHDPNFYGDDECQLFDPVLDNDEIPDTPADPGPNSICFTSSCPSATNSCTLTCDMSFSSLNAPFVPVNPVPTYTFPAGYLTNNIMSYYNFCPVRTFTPGQIALMNAVLNNPSSSRYFLNTPPPFCNNNIAEDGRILKFCDNSLNVEKLPLKNLIVDMKNEITDWTDIETTDLAGGFKVYQQNYSNDVYVSIKPKASHPLALTDPENVPLNYQPSNGVTTLDIFNIHKHTLALESLPNPYNWIAADVNNSGSITSFDIVQIRKVILGLQNDFTSGTYKFIPEHYLLNSTFASDFSNNPFTASYSGLGYPAYTNSDLVLDMDDAAVAQGKSWSYVAFKVVDVNCNMSLEELGGNDDSGLVNNIQGSGPCLDASVILTVEVDALNIVDKVTAFQLGLSFDMEKLVYIGAAPAELPDFKFDNFVAERNQIRMLWYKDDATAEAMNAPKTLFKLHFKVRKPFCDVNQAISLNDNITKNMFYGEKLPNSVEADVRFNWEKNVESPKGIVNSIYPNPAVNGLSFNLHLNEAANVRIEVSDYQGNSVSHESQYASGDHTYNFNSITTLSPGALNYTVKFDNFTYSGMLIKSPN